MTALGTERADVPDCLQERVEKVPFEVVNSSTPAPVVSTTDIRSLPDFPLTRTHIEASSLEPGFAKSPSRGMHTRKYPGTFESDRSTRAQSDISSSAIYRALVRGLVTVASDPARRLTRPVINAFGQGRDCLVRLLLDKITCFLDNFYWTVNVFSRDRGDQKSFQHSFDLVSCLILRY